MSRVADALRKAERADRSPADPAIRRNDMPNIDISSVSVPWDVESVLRAGSAASSHSAQDEPSARRVERSNFAVGSTGAGDAVSEPQSTDFVELVQRVFRPSTGQPIARSVVFLSVGMSGSHQMVAVDVARTLAGYGAGSVCLVDASFGAVALHEHVGLPASPGLSDVLLAGRSPVSLAVPLGEQLWMLPGGEPLSARPARLTEALAPVLRELTAQFDFVIIETPEYGRDLGMATLLTVAPLTDGVVLVLEAERTRRDVAAEVVARLRACGVAVLGAVLTNRSTRNGRPGSRALGEM